MELHVAAEAGFTEEVIAFISAGGEVDVRDDGGETLLTLGSAIWPNRNRKGPDLRRCRR